MSLLASIIIPCHNNQRFVKLAIMSALAQTYPHSEIIVIDDGSTDDSLAMVKSFGDRVTWESGPNQGAPVARNRGLVIAKGEYVKFLDADDVLLPDCLTRQVAQARELPQNSKAIVYGDALWIDQAGQPLSGYPVRPRRPDEEAVAHILTQSPLTSCPLHRRDYLLEIGGFDTSLPRGQEFDLHLRLVLAGVEFIHQPGPVYQYRDYQAGQRLSQQGYSRKGPLAYFQILQKQQHHIETQTGRPLTPAVRQIMARRFWTYGRGVLRDGFPAEAMRYFEAARQLDPRHCIVGNAPYPTLVKLLGPNKAETVARKLQALVGRAA